MKQDTRELGMAAAVWVVAAIVVLALGRIDLVADRAAAHETVVAAAPPIEASVPPTSSDAGDPEPASQGNEAAATERVRPADPILLTRPSASDERLGPELRATVRSSERGPWSPPRARVTSKDGTTTSGPDDAADSRAGAGSTEPALVAPTPEPKPGSPEKKLRPARVKPRPAEPEPESGPVARKPKPKPQPHPKPDVKPGPKPGDPRPKPEPAEPVSEQAKADQTKDRGGRGASAD